jgi:hypothetical protein
MFWRRGLRATGTYPPHKPPMRWEVEDMAKLVWEMIEAEPSYRKIERTKFQEDGLLGWRWEMVVV